MRRGLGPLLAGFALAVLCWSGSAAAQTIVVGGKAFTEQQIMTAMTVALLKAKGFTPDRKTGMGSAMTGYHFKIGKNQLLGLQLNVGNLFNEVEPIIYRRNTNTNGQLYKPTHYQWPTPRNWRLTADYTF